MVYYLSAAGESVETLDLSSLSPRHLILVGHFWEILWAGHDSSNGHKVHRSPANPLSVSFNQVPILSSRGRRDHLGTTLTHLVLEEKQPRCSGDSSVRLSGQRAASGAMQASFSGRVLEGSSGHEEACWYSSPQSLLRLSPAPSPHI